MNCAPDSECFITPRSKKCLLWRWVSQDGRDCTLANELVSSKCVTCSLVGSVKNHLPFRGRVDVLVCVAADRRGATSGEEKNMDESQEQCEQAET